ncbi:hypothetical protein [Jidongwangia harbinensis]|uniref:hypothetical protein n=1 Tax=Jidongwangia harbinensis TaxID=2878561 RepID=UPI001CD95FE7|nr:hypothetical protein [Jidongwangia harbinensis]MCA2215444.1 hypothetical protein [Jidongwangia harbinensis]
MPRSSLLVPVYALILLGGCPVLLGACTDDATPPPSAASVTGSPAEAPVTEETPGLLACGTLSTAVTDGTLMTPGVVDGIVRASATADAPVADAAQRLAAAYASAVAASGMESEPDAVAAVSAAAADMTGVCDDSGLERVG